jgi:hypothetical protein
MVVLRARRFFQKNNDWLLDNAMLDKEKFSTIRAMLNKYWNPIPLTLSEDDDEYDDYARYIVGHPPWSQQKLAKYLLYIEYKVIGMSVNNERKVIAKDVAKRIMELHD